MKKIILGLALGICLTVPAWAAETQFSFSVKEENKATFQQQIDRYQKEAKEIIEKAEKEIADAQGHFDKVKKNSEKD